MTFLLSKSRSFCRGWTNFSPSISGATGASQNSHVCAIKLISIRSYSTKRVPPAQCRTPRESGFTTRKMPAFPSSVFSAGTARRAAEHMKRFDTDPQEPVRSRRTSRPDLPDRPLTPSEWARLKESSHKPERFHIQAMEGLLNRAALVSRAEVDTAKSLLTYVAVEQGSVSYELLLRFLTLCVMGGHHAEVFDTYEVMRSCFRTLDTGASSLFIKGFSQTERWREALVVLEDLKKTILPSTRNYGDVIGAAALRGDAATCWALYEEMLGEGLVPLQDTWRALFQAGMEGGGAQEERLFSVLSYMRDNQVYPEEELVTTIKAWFESLPGERWSGRFSLVSGSGQCEACRESLESLQLTEEEYARLKEQVMKNVIQGSDVFRKTTPEELESFKKFVKQKPPFDIVIDGLNVANTTPKATPSETLLAVVSELELQGLNILLLGRKHMLRASRNWDRLHMRKIQQKAHCFFTENISEDDPFLLYAALHSGPHCLFLSRDLMRDHKACFPEPATRRLFFKWQRGHQLVTGHYAPGKRVRFQGIPAYDTIVQTTGRSWHIPYDEKATGRASYEVPQKWICLTRGR